MKTFRPFLAVSAIIAACISGPALAQTKIEIMSGSMGDSGPSTYLQMVREMSAACSEIPGFPTFVEKVTTGSNASFAALVDNQVPAVVGQGDVAHFLARTQNLTSVRLIAPLHREQVHFIVKADANVGSWYSGAAFWDKSDKSLTKVEQLNGGSVGVIDGSGAFTTARLIRDAANLPYTVTVFPSEALMRKALDSGAVNAVVYVGGAPVPAVAAYGKGYRLLSVSPESVKKLEGAYEAASVNYPTLARAGEAATISTRAGLFVWNYKAAKWQAPFLALQKCLSQEFLEDIQETPKTHKAWRDVKPTANLWPLWEPNPAFAAQAAPAPAPAPVAPVAPAKKGK